MIREETKVLDKGFVALVDKMGNDSSIVQAARVSYGKGTKTKREDEGLIRYLVRHKHTTPLEMCVFKFHIKAPLFVFRQWHRHRSASINEASGRYSEMSDEFYVPELNSIKTQSQENMQGRSTEKVSEENRQNVRQCMEQDQKEAFDSYEYYLGQKVSRELARINLPLSIYSEMYWKMDLHNLFHFLKLRMDEKAQWEIREYANAIFELIKPCVPFACKAFEDYILNSESFTGKEIKIITELLGDFTLDDIKGKGLSKRERREFLSKLGLEYE